MRILLIVPFAAERGALAELLRGDGHQVIPVATRDRGLEEASTSDPETIIADAQVLGLDGLALVRELAGRLASARLILLCPRAHDGLPPPGVLCLTKPIEYAKLQHHLATMARDRVA
jgi:DNA-binding response OmpR family regulator